MSKPAPYQSEVFRSGREKLQTCYRCDTYGVRFKASANQLLQPMPVPRRGGRACGRGAGAHRATTRSAESPDGFVRDPLPEGAGCRSGARGWGVRDRREPHRMPPKTEAVHPGTDRVSSPRAERPASAHVHAPSPATRSACTRCRCRSSDTPLAASRSSGTSRSGSLRALSAASSGVRTWTYASSSAGLAAPALVDEPDDGVTDLAGGPYDALTQDLAAVRCSARGGQGVRRDDELVGGQ